MSEEHKPKSSLWEKTVKLLPKKDKQKSERTKSSASKNKSTPAKVTPPESPVETMAEEEVSQTKNTLQLDAALALKKSTLKFKNKADAIKTVATPFGKKIKGKVWKQKPEITDTDEESGRVWDESLAQMEISKKRHSVIHREIAGTTGSTRHVTILAPMPEYYTVPVRKLKPNTGKMRNYPVMKPARPDAHVEKAVCYGPRLNSEGRIIRHSILGETSDFLKEATKRNQFKEITELQTKVVDIMPVSKLYPKGPENSLLREDLALHNWDSKMKERKLEMKRLSGLIGCPERQLLMSKTDDFIGKSKGRNVITAALDFNLEKHPGVTFWKLQDSLGSKQIRSTLTRQEIGLFRTPEMSGDAASVRAQKGALREPYDSSWFSSEYLNERDEQVGGVIKICNQMLFDDLEVCGKCIAKPEKSTGSTSVKDNVGRCSPGGDAASHTYIPEVDSGVKDRDEKCFTGPCLKIEDTILSWVEGRYQGDVVVKATYVLIEGLAGDMCSNYIYLQNCGTTSIKYHWMKCIEAKPIPVPRPRRPAAFYRNAEDGIILPGDTEKIEVKFRSHVPGSFSESWLLGTVPLLAAGGQIKFILKGWARVKKDYSEECRRIQETLEKREAMTLCSYLTNEMIDKIILKAYLQSLKLLEETDRPTPEMLFEQENNWLYFHAHIVKRLRSLYTSLKIELTGAPPPENDDILSVTALYKLIRSLPDTTTCDSNDDDDNNIDVDDDDDDDDDECQCRKEVLLWKLYCDVSILSFKPFSPVVCPNHLRYFICYGLLLDGVRQAVHQAESLANQLDLVVKITEAEMETAKPKEKGRGKGHINSGKPKTKKVEEPKDVETKGPSTADPKLQAFSPVYQYREKKDRDNAVLNKYDEKVYIMVYSMLDGVVEKMMDLFDTL